MYVKSFNCIAYFALMVFYKSLIWVTLGFFYEIGLYFLSPVVENTTIIITMESLQCQECFSRWWLLVYFYKLWNKNDYLTIYMSKVTTTTNWLNSGFVRFLRKQMFTYSKYYFILAYFKIIDIRFVLHLISTALRFQWWLDS